MKKSYLGIVLAVFLLLLAARKIARVLHSDPPLTEREKIARALAEEEQYSERATLKKLVRERFELLYPASWSIDLHDEDYDPDHQFSIDSPGEAFVMFILFDTETDPENNIQGQISVFREEMEATTVEPFDKYGQHKGTGVIIRGQMQDIPVTVRAFSCSSESLSAIVVQFCPDEELEQTKKGFSLIEKSFILNPKCQEETPTEVEAASSRTHAHPSG